MKDTVQAELSEMRQLIARLTARVDAYDRAWAALYDGGVTDESDLAAPEPERPRGHLRLVASGGRATP